MQRPKKQPTGNYKVGYCRPPKLSQWKPGQSGNPNGKPPPEALDLLRFVGGALRRRVSVPIGGKVVRMTMMEAIAHKLAADAATGVPNARRELLKLMSFAEAIDEYAEPMVIEAKLVFEEEENRYMKTFQENERLTAEVQRLRAQLDSRENASGPLL